MVPAKDEVDLETAKYPALFSFESVQESIYGEYFDLLSKTKVLKGTTTILEHANGLIGNRHSELFTPVIHASQ